MNNITYLSDHTKGDDKRPTFSDAIKEYSAQTNVAYKDVCYLARLEHELGECKLALMTKRIIDIIVTQERRSRGLKDSSIRRELNILQAVLWFAHDMGMCDQRVDVRKPRDDSFRDVWLTASQRNEFIELCSPEFRAFAAFLFYTGARLGEALNATWEDCVNDCFVFKSRKGKDSKLKIRSVPMHPVLDNYLTREDSGYVLTLNKMQWYRRDIYDHWNLARKKMGITGLTPHCARHTFASLLVMSNKVDLRTVADLLGHSGMEMVKRYSHLSTAHLKTAIEHLPD